MYCRKNPKGFSTFYNGISQYSMVLFPKINGILPCDPWENDDHLLVTICFQETQRGNLATGTFCPGCWRCCCRVPHPTTSLKETGERSLEKMLLFAFPLTTKLRMMYVQTDLDQGLLRRFHSRCLWAQTHQDRHEELAPGLTPYPKRLIKKAP